MKLPGVISLRKALPIWPMPNGGFFRAAVSTLLKFTKIPLRRLRTQVMQAGFESTGPRWVFTQSGELLSFGPLPAGAAVGADDLAMPFSGAFLCFASNASSRWSSQWHLWQLRHSTSGSTKVSTWPDASQTRVGQVVEESRPTTSSRPRTKVCHHWDLMFVLEFDAQRTVVPCRAGTAVDLSCLEDESSAFGQGDDGIQLGLCHDFLLLDSVRRRRAARGSQVLP